MNKRSGCCLSSFLSIWMYTGCFILTLIYGNLNGLIAETPSPIQISLHAERTEAAPNEPFWVVAHVQLEEGWHTYGQDPGDAGFPLEVKWHLPEGFAVAPSKWPAPIQFSTDGLVSFGYADELLLLFQITPPENLEHIHPKLEAELSWLACSDSQCVPGKATVTATFPSAPQIVEPLFAQARSQIAQVDQELISLGEDDSSPASDVSMDAAPLSFLEQNGIAMILFFAFLGGLILNCMPCVLPVISLKILSFIKLASQQRSKIFKHGAAFAAGVLTSFWILASILLLMQTYGRSLGWGFQLQEPLFVALLAAVLWILSLNLFGLFETGTSLSSLAGDAQSQAIRSRCGYLSSFFSGTLATAVATPCTGPFLGPVVGFAVTASPLQAMLTFSFVGFGMAAPYLLLAAFPNLMVFLPKPGKWMVTFKQLMGFLMVATVLWLAWIFGAETSSMGLLVLLISFFLLAIGGWIYGKWGAPIQKQKVRYLSYIFTLFCGIAAVYTLTIASSFIEETTSSSSSQVADLDGWEPFSLERIAALQEQGVPVFVDFTAKWCLICQVNHSVLTDAGVTKSFAARKVVKMKADWTKKDAQITQALQKYGRNAVPLYLFFSGNPGEEPQILPQLLTAQIINNALQ